MKTRIILVLLLIGFASQAQIKIDKQHFVDLLSEGRYGDVFREASEIRKKEYGKCLMIDYFIAKALCGDGYNKEATLKFSSILKNYKLSDENRIFIGKERESCKSGPEPGTRRGLNLNSRDFNNIMAMSLPEAAVRGKMGMISNCKMPPQEMTYLRDIPMEELESRLFRIDQGEAAIAKYKSILNSNYHVGVSGRFLLITYGNTVLNQQQQKETSDRLEKAYNFFISYYGLRPPDKLLAVYLLPDKYTFRLTAKLVHGLKVPDANIGYSNISDLSLVGVSDVSRIGTLIHELFHLMVRTDVGDIPPWMDEGIACIYETSKWVGDKLVGDVHNWRSDVLAGASYEMRQLIPRLSEFVNYNWKQFDGLETNDQCKASVDYAYGKHFMLWFQEQGKLTDLFRAVKNRSEISNDTLAHFQNDIELIELTLGNSIENIEKNFNDWLLKTYSIRLNTASVLPTGSSSSNTSVNSGSSVSNLPSTPDKPAANDANNVSQVMVEKPVFAEPDANSLNVVQQAVPEFTANDVLNVVTLRVKKDFNDKMGENAFAYTYYLEGDSKFLDQIQEVNYQRNHPSFQEYGKFYQKSSNRSKNFAFKGYQWGYIETVNVYLIMKDQTKSDIILKTIVYDN
ncbi:MAG: hypothetical protein JNK09_15370 [Prolixibacteraceae bacterium]|nr:hypothetical protein [Prolixibacteraceae bacterium]